MDRGWRLKAWILLALFLGPFLIQAGLGMLWIWQRGWLATTAAALVWIATGAVFSLLARRWSDSPRSIIPPLDWDEPQTFTPLDRTAWSIVANESQRGESLRQQALLGPEVYLDAGQTLLRKLAEHYHPNSETPLDQIPLIELLTALELASEDLAGLCRQIPGGDLITLSHWRKAVQAAGYANKANDIYSYLLPLINPVSGLARLGAREWIVKPAWRSTQENILRWFFEAYVNRLGMHLIELLSGRLASGSLQYRRLTRGVSWAKEAHEPPPRLIVAFMDRSGSGLVGRLREGLAGAGPEAADLGLGAPPLDRLPSASWVDAQGCLPATAPASRRDRAGREHALKTALAADLILCELDLPAAGDAVVQSLAHDWSAYFTQHSHRIPPPIILIGHGLASPYPDPTERSLVLARLDALRMIFPPGSVEFVEIGPDPTPAFRLLGQALSHVLPKADRVALLRELRSVSDRSTLSRLASQLGTAGRLIASNLRRPKGSGSYGP